MSGSATYPQPASLHSGDIVEWLRSLPADQREEFDMIESTAVLVQVGATNLYQVGPNHIDVHTHDTVDEAAECYASMAARYRETAAPDSPQRMLAEALSASGGDPREQLRALLAAVQGSSQAVPAVRQAAMPADGPTGMYL